MVRVHSATVLKSLSKLSEYLNAIERLKTYYPNQIIVHNPTSLSYADRKQPLLRELDMVGINEKTLFPGLDGIGRYMERKFRFDYNEAVENT